MLYGKCNLNPLHTAAINKPGTDKLKLLHPGMSEECILWVHYLILHDETFDTIDELVEQI